MKTETRLLSTKEVARILSISHRTLENMRQRKVGPHYVRVGRTIRYWENEVIKWIEQGTIRLAS